MSLGEKITLVFSNAGRFGVNMMLEALGVSKGTWHYRLNRKLAYDQKYKHLKKPLLKIAKDHSEYGYRDMLPVFRTT